MIAETRRKQLRQWIDVHHDGKPARFAASVSRPQPQIADVLDGRKAFGEKLARSLEKKAGMPERYLDDVSGTGARDQRMLIFGTKVTRAGVLLGAAWDGLELTDRIELEQEILARAAKRARAADQPTEQPGQPDKD